MKKFNKDSALRKLRIKQNKNTYIKRLSISLSCLVLLVIVVLFTFAKFEVSSEEYTLIRGKVKYLTCEYSDGQVVYEKGYTGSAQTFTPKCDGKYKLEVWGAQGGQGFDNSSNTNSKYGGKGGYSYGSINLSKNTNLYVYVGGQGKTASSTGQLVSGGFNGGGSVPKTGHSGSGGGSGGGASDIRIGTDSLYSRVIVAGGGGGLGYPTESTAGVGGGTSGTTGIGSNSSDASSTGGTQTGGGTCSGSYGGTCGSSGTFGQGGNGGTNGTNAGGGAGGGGWYGGTGGKSGSSNSCKAGGGGSGYVYTSSTASNYPSGCLLNSSHYLTDASTKAGNTSFTSPSGSSETGHEGDGYARITFLSTN